MRGLTLYQSHATLVALADRRRYPNQGGLYKCIETRPRNINYRGPIAIHAAKTFPPWAVAAALGSEWIRAALVAAGYLKLADLPLGVIVAVAELVDTERIHEHNAPLEPERSYGDYTPGRWAWHLDDIRALPEPIPCRGAQGLWPVPQHAMARLAEMGVAV